MESQGTLFGSQGEGEDVDYNMLSQIAIINASLKKEDLLCNEEELKLASKINVAISCNLGAYYRMKIKWIQFFQKNNAGCYYTGNLALGICADCSQTLDIWPCREKRIFILPRSQCGFCKSERYYDIMPSYEWNNYNRVRPTTVFRKYIVHE